MYNLSSNTKVNIFGDNRNVIMLNNLNHAFLDIS